MAKYFDRFPLVSYNDSVAKNLLTRVDFTPATRKDIYSKFDYVLDEAIFRPDLVSDTYYGSPFYDWLIYMQNNVIDPYHDFYKSEQDVQKMVISKYGSVETATKIILFYRNNWSADDGIIPVETFDNLSATLKKYYKPNIDINNKIIGYSRIQEDWVRSTNKIVKLRFIPGDIDTVNVNDILTQSSTNAKGTVAQKDLENNILTIQHITGAFETSESILEINEGPVDPITNKLLWQPIVDEEVPFWAPVSAYDYEFEKNALKRYVSMVKDNFLQDIEKMFIQQVSL